MNIETYTYDEFCKHLIQMKVGASCFQGRAAELPFKPKFIAVWQFIDIETNNKIDAWFKKTDFIGWTNKVFPGQAEFENIEDIMHFKLRWL